MKASEVSQFLSLPLSLDLLYNTRVQSINKSRAASRLVSLFYFTFLDVASFFLRQWLLLFHNTLLSVCLVFCLLVSEGMHCSCVKSGFVF